MIRTLLRGKKRKAGLDAGSSTLQSLRDRYPDITDFEIELVEATRRTTMTSPERLMSLVRAIDYLVDANISGDMVECGVWRGGSMFAAAKTLMRHGATDRTLWLYDTFDGMSPPGEADVDFLGQTARKLLDSRPLEDEAGIWCHGPLEGVRKHLRESQYPEQRIQFVPGKVEDTLRKTLPEKIALLRLDTDWYESTRCELECLYPRLVPGGVLIIDDYGHWHGCRRAVDEYLREHRLPILLQRIDYTGRIAVKPQ